MYRQVHYLNAEWSQLNWSLILFKQDFSGCYVDSIIPHTAMYCRLRESSSMSSIDWQHSKRGRTKKFLWYPWVFFSFLWLYPHETTHTERGFDPAKSHGTLHDWSKMPIRRLRMWTINVVIYDTPSWIHYRTESINATFNTINYLLPVWINVFQLLK